MIKLSDLKNKHFLALTGNLVISVFSLITMSLLYRSLSKAEVGVWFLFLGIQSLAEAIRAGFLSTAAVKFYAGTEKNRGLEVLGSVWFIALAITLTLVLLNAFALLFIPFIHNPATIIIVKWIGITFMSSLPFTVPIWILMADEDYTNLLKLRLINSISMFLIIIILIYSKEMNLRNLFILNFATNLLTGIFCFLNKLTHIGAILKTTKSTINEIAEFN
jgi:O-antigen/teichoic acid export membrane protein